MPVIALVVLQHVFLLFLYLFIFYLVRWMIRDLRDLVEMNTAGEVPAAPDGAGRFESGRLVVLDGAGPAFKPGDTFDLGVETVLGRSSESTVIIPDDFVSKQHARITRAKGRYRLEDLGSRNGTFVNGNLVKRPVVLSEGDRIKIGDVIFQFTGWRHEVDSAN